MKIKVEVEVFDDSEYCEDSYEECDYLDSSECNLFLESLMAVGGSQFYLKCPECLEAPKVEEGTILTAMELRSALANRVCFGV